MLNFLPENGCRENFPNQSLEFLSRNLPDLINSRKVREEIVYQLRKDPYVIALAPLAFTERDMLLFSYLASAYVYARGETPATHIPTEIATPLVLLSTALQRKPILSYSSYCLNNWRRKQLDGDFSVENLELLQQFCDGNHGQRDESWFILIHVNIEDEAGPAINSISKLLTGEEFSEEVLGGMIQDVYYSLFRMNNVLARMPEQCDPDNYFRFVRPYIFSFENVIYEGCFSNVPQTYRGETGAQSSIIPAILPALGIKHKDSMLTKHLQDMRDYMPLEHRQFIKAVEDHKTNFREIALANPKLKTVYNGCVNEIIKFRQKHFEYAVQYIANKVDNPKGTGGTPYIQWLNQLKEETEQHLL